MLATNARECAERAIVTDQLHSICFTNANAFPAEGLQRLAANDAQTTYQPLSSDRHIARARQGLYRKGTVALLNVGGGKYSYIVQYTGDAQYGVPPTTDLDWIQTEKPIWFIPMTIFHLPRDETILWDIGNRVTPSRIVKFLPRCLERLREIFDE